MTSRPCPRIISSLVGVWTSSAPWHRSGRSTCRKMLQANPRLSKTDVPPTHPSPPSTRPRFLARTLLSLALVPPTPSTRAQATQPSENLLSRLRRPLLIPKIRTKIQVPATTTTNSLPWTRCPCSNKHSGCPSQSKACQMHNWPICSLLACRRPTRSAT